MNDQVVGTANDFLLYTTPNGEVRLDVFLQNETIWLTQKTMAELFGVEVNTINYHLKEIYDSQELTESSTIRKIRIVQKEGHREVSREKRFYNLDAVISVGYRVNSRQATYFRIWATQVLKEYMIKGFSMDDERLKQGKRVFGQNYFQELLERIRDIRSSEAQFYEQIKDIYATSIDYDSEAAQTQEFFATLQNKIHVGLMGQTAAEIITSRADHQATNMGLQTWKNAPNGATRANRV